MTGKDHSISEDSAKKLMHGDYGKECAKLIEGYTTAISWNSNPNQCSNLIGNNGTIFVVDTQDHLFAVTAGHVYSGYCDAKNAYGAECAIGGFAFNPVDRLINHCTTLDIATFKIHENEINQIGIKQSLTLWPPMVPEENKGIILTGIPGNEREEVNDNEVIFDKYSVLATASSISERQITCHINRDEVAPIKGRQMPPKDFDIGGMSGGPVLAVRESGNGLVSFPLAGVITQGNGDTIFASRADVIQADGTIKRQYLP